jgi:hypothetical protein
MACENHSAGECGQNGSNLSFPRLPLPRLAAVDYDPLGAYSFSRFVVTSVARDIYSYTIKTSVAKGPKFQPQNSKGALQKFVRPENWRPNFLKICQKRAEHF